MTFKEFLKLDELDGQFGAVKSHSGPLNLIQTITKMAKVPSGRVNKMMSGSMGPARPVKVTSVAGPMTNPSVLK